MVDAFDGVYLIRLDVDDWGWGKDSPDGFYVTVIPVFFALDANGEATGETIDGNAWGENISANMAPPLKDFFQGLK